MENIQVLVIHVRGNQERKAFIQQQLDEVGFSYHYIAEGNISDLTPEILDKYFVNDGKPDTMYGPFPRTSCAYKHLLATQYIIDHQLEGALIVEDDLRFYPLFKNLFIPRSQRKKGVLLYPASRDRFAGCYFLNDKGAHVIMDYVTKHKSDTTSDCLHNRLVQEGLLSYFWSHPCLACQCSCDGSMLTMIPTRPRPLKRLKWFYKRFYKHLLYSLR